MLMRNQRNKATRQFAPQTPFERLLRQLYRAMLILLGTLYILDLVCYVFFSITPISSFLREVIEIFSPTESDTMIGLGIHGVWIASIVILVTKNSIQWQPYNPTDNWHLRVGPREGHVDGMLVGICYLLLLLGLAGIIGIIWGVTQQKGDSESFLGLGVLLAIPWGILLTAMMKGLRKSLVRKRKIALPQLGLTKDEVVIQTYDLFAVIPLEKITQLNLQGLARNGQLLIKGKGRPLIRLSVLPFDSQGIQDFVEAYALLREVKSAEQIE